VSGGVAVQVSGEARWRLSWTAPTPDAGRVVLDVAANAADGDESQMGDRVYTLTLESAPPVGLNALQPLPGMTRHAAGWCRPFHRRTA
jgi:hypothetical protein